MRLRSAPVGADRRVAVATTDRSDGDLAIHGEPDALAAHRAAVTDRRWVWLEQVHGALVVEVHTESDVDSACGARADALVTSRNDVAVAVHSADCATVARWSDVGVIGVAHAGWRGLHAGVIESTVAAMRRSGATSVGAFAGPSICPSCYEFVGADLVSMVDRFGPAVASVSARGTESLDTRAAVDLALASCEVELVGRDERCTACAAAELWSHRARADRGRQAFVAWLEDLR